MGDDVMARIVAAVELGRGGEREAARRALGVLWDEMGGDGDPFHQCVLAHFMADLQDDGRAELEWDERALVAVASVTDERAREYDSSLQVRGFMPSLYLSLADDHRRLGDAERAREFLERARSVSDALGDDPYGTTVKNAMEGITKALAEGSTDPLPG
ncbi:hypothetical protein [Pseudonocardia humida]|uniref:Tetratricopeptide repeat protein n=1 Tax=Pseudonocardia humida TaxID=2800819 RepID=A0ABT0ZU05_9PSEU|nr:hypothetical protein [Pseudonocardia humida]MCO1654210.1 hypothetical protein [Pseudonocardia humida]